MHAATDDGGLSTFEGDPPLGAVRPGGAELGPISPELALVDPLLAEQARRLLPDPGERLTPRPRPAAAPTESVPVTESVGEAALPAPPKVRRWRRTVLLAGLVFAAGAASGGFLGEKRAASPGALEVRSTSVASAPLRPPRVDEGLRTTTQKRRVAQATWAANVLGVAARVDPPGVMLVWQRPADSEQVVVLRSLATRTRGVVV